MIEGHILPATGIVAGSAIRSKLTVVGVPGSVTAITVRWRAFKPSICMARLAVDTRMLSGQSKAGEFSMIEIHICPTARVMALSTIRPELAFMLIILLVA